MWRAGASVFSGRPDPSWELEPATARRLTELWDGLPPLVGEPAPAPPLGYRGCFAESQEGTRYEAYRNVVKLTRPRTEIRYDADRTFEREILASAPSGVLPPWLED